MAPTFPVANGVVEASQGQPMLYEFITLNREEIIARCRAKVAKRSIPPPSDEEIFPRWNPLTSWMIEDFERAA
jgi:hypothetical protein